jgi:hypothetical protein
MRKAGEQVVGVLRHLSWSLLTETAILQTQGHLSPKESPRGAPQGQVEPRANCVYPQNATKPSTSPLSPLDPSGSLNP